MDYIIYAHGFFYLYQTRRLSGFSLENRLRRGARFCSRCYNLFNPNATQFFDCLRKVCDNENVWKLEGKFQSRGLDCRNLAGVKDQRLNRFRTELESV